MTATLASMDSRTLITLSRSMDDITNIEDHAIRNALPYGVI